MGSVKLVPDAPTAQTHCSGTESTLSLVCTRGPRDSQSSDKASRHLGLRCASSMDIGHCQLSLLATTGLVLTCLAACATPKQVFALQPTNSTVLSPAETTALTPAANYNRGSFAGILETQQGSYFAYAGLTSSDLDGEIKIFDSSRTIRSSLALPTLTTSPSIAIGDNRLISVMQQTSPKTNTVLLAGQRVIPRTISLQESANGGQLALNTLKLFDNPADISNGAPFDLTLATCSISLPDSSFVIVAKATTDMNIIDQNAARYDMLLQTVRVISVSGNVVAQDSLTSGLNSPGMSMSLLETGHILVIPLRVSKDLWNAFSTSDNVPFLPFTWPSGPKIVSQHIQDTDNKARGFFVSDLLDATSYVLTTNTITATHPNINFGAAGLSDQKPMLFKPYALVVFFGNILPGGSQAYFVSKADFQLVDISPATTSSSLVMESLLFDSTSSPFNISLGWLDSPSRVFLSNRLVVTGYCNLNESSSLSLSSPSAEFIANLDLNCLKDQVSALPVKTFALVSAEYSADDESVILKFDTELHPKLVGSNLTLTLIAENQIQILNQTEFSTSFSSADPRAIVIKLQTKITVYSASMKITADSSFSPIRSQSRLAGFSDFPIEIRSISSGLPESLKNTAAAAQSIGQAAGGTAAVASIALVAANPGAAFFITQIMATFVYMALIGGDFLVLPSRVLASLSSPELIDLGIQTKISSYVLPERCTASDILLDNEYSCNFLLNYGSGVVSLAVTFGVSLLVFSCFRWFQSAAHKPTPEAAISSTEIKSSQLSVGDEQPKYPRWSLGWALSGLNNAYGLHYSLMTLEAIPLELLTCVFIQLRYGDASSGAGKLGYFLASLLLLIYLGFLSALCLLAIQVRDQHTTKKNSGVRSDQPELGSFRAQEKPTQSQDSVLGSAIQPIEGGSPVQKASKPTELKNLIEFDKLQLAPLSFVYEGFRGDFSSVVIFAPAAKILRGILLSCLVVVGSEWGLTQVLLVFFLEISFTSYQLVSQPKLSKLELGVDASSGILCALYSLGKAISFAEMSDEARQGKIGLVLSWLLIIYIAISMLYAVIILLISLCEIAISAYRSLKGSNKPLQKIQELSASESQNLDNTNNSWKGKYPSGTVPQLPSASASKKSPDLRTKLNKVKHTEQREERHLFSVDTPPDDEKNDAGSPADSIPAQNPSGRRVLRFRTRKNMAIKQQLPTSTPVPTVLAGLVKQPRPAHRIKPRRLTPPSILNLN